MKMHKIAHIVYMMDITFTFVTSILMKKMMSGENSCTHYTDTLIQQSAVAIPSEHLTFLKSFAALQEDVFQ